MEFLNKKRENFRKNIKLSVPGHSFTTFHVLDRLYISHSMSRISTSDPLLTHRNTKPYFHLRLKLKIPYDEFKGSFQQNLYQKIPGLEAVRSSDYRIAWLPIEPFSFPWALLPDWGRQWTWSWSNGSNPKNTSTVIPYTEYMNHPPTSCINPR